MPPDELLVDGNGKVNSEQFVVWRAASIFPDGSEHTQAELSHPLMFTHVLINGSNSHSQLPQPPDDELDELDEGAWPDEELDELDELELLIVILLLIDCRCDRTNTCDPAPRQAS